MEPQYRLNNHITAPELRVVDEQGEFLGILPLSEALKMAYDRDLDLVEIAPTAKPPVAKIISYDKFRYQKEKEAKKQRALQKVSELKQIRIGSTRIAKNDLEIRLRQMEKFANEGHKIEIVLALRGREKGNRDFAMQKMREFMTMIPFEYKILVEPKFGGRGILTQIIKK